MKEVITLTYNGETHTLAEWSRITGTSPRTLYQRLKLGWTAKQTLDGTPPPRGADRGTYCAGCIYWRYLSGADAKACHYAFDTRKMRGHKDKNGRWSAPARNCPCKRGWRKETEKGHETTYL